MSDFIPIPKKEYSVIYADPPWRYADKGCNGNAADHYPTMSFSEMRRLPVGDIAAKDRVLFLWATYPMMREAAPGWDFWGNEAPMMGGGGFSGTR